MGMKNRQTAYENLIALAEIQGYNIRECHGLCGRIFSPYSRL